MKNKEFDMGFNFICEDCIIVFRVYANIKKGSTKIFCPKCGENVATRRYETVVKSDKRVVIPWSESEIDIVKQCIEGDLRPYQVCVITGRSLSSVRHKMKRLQGIEKGR